ncbi:HNH endonuclease signature motif containing protein [Mycolicibacterium sp. jd]|uniref:HNH endonuclease signature motif containing protein n=1 Tax=unclassified Mycolicibacterium TaxID=2636767 RepID=UPI00351B30E7
MGCSREDVLGAFDALDTVVESILALDYDAVSAAERVGLDARLERNLRRIPTVEHELLASVIAETEPARLGEGSWKKVLTTALRISGAEAGRRLKRAKTLGPRRGLTGTPLPPLWESTAAAQAQGLLSEEHVAVIAAFHKRLPAWVDIETRAEADRQLAHAGSGLDPEGLDEAAGVLLAMINPDGAQPCDKERARKRGIRISKQHPDGTATISGTLTPEALAIWQAIFAKEAAPGANLPESEQTVDSTSGGAADDASDAPGDHAGAASSAASGASGGAEHDPQPDRCGSDTRTQAQRNHDAFLAVGRRLLESGELGTHNGLPVTVIVSTTLQELEKGAGFAVTGGGSLLPMPDLIRMAARAHHYLYVYDQHSGQSLYLGRAKRLANAAQRIVLHARDRGCTRPGCTAPGYWCQAHHASADFVDGGLTNIDDLTLACPCDHRMLDNTGWRTRKNGKNQTEWLPPPDLDTGQHRVNGHHHPERYLLPEDDLPEDDQGP